jgi:c-di-GMP-binding flagellar brake protein YcgR
VLIEELIGSRQPCGVSFKSGDLKVVFAAAVNECNTSYRLNAATVVEALLLEYPAEIKAVQRRASYRVHVPEDAGIAVKIWRKPPHALLEDLPLAVQAVTARLRELSTGGMGVVLNGNRGERPKINADDRLRIQITHRAHDLLLEGMLRHALERIDNSSVRAGIQFQPLTSDMRCRQTLAGLTRIVGDLQRTEVRRHRKGITQIQ